MTATTGIDKCLLKCDFCANTIADDAEGATFIHGWSKCRESSLWECQCCQGKRSDDEEREFSHMRSAVRAYNDARRDGDYESAKAIAYSHGVIASPED